jgi:tetratricopeptide (TPR) repeat protein/tRNA A-37 threonylcarbamoyl transferase component Bud32
MLRWVVAMDEGRSDCPSPDDLEDFAQRHLSASEEKAIAAHLESCEACSHAAHGLASTHPPATEPLRHARMQIEPGTRVGRYVVLALVGRGAMGEVYSAYDPKLDRRLAVKVLRGVGDDSELGDDRLLLEAQAMARLVHPNVVAVHDAGTYAGGVFLAMDLIDGRTLRHWLREARRSARAIEALFLMAGRGLAAAHAAGIVHRDFKPDNVLVDRSGRAFVTDFGLARQTPSARPDPRSIPADELRLTATGAVIGTPLYMAPEQLRGEKIDARADVFAFCVALYEALCGAHPFSTESRSALEEAVTAGRIRPKPAGARVPRRIWRAMVRGLHPDPAQRLPSLEPLLGELGRDRRLHRLSVVGFSAAAALAAVAVAGVATLGNRDDHRVAVCTAAGEAARAALWNPARADALARAFSASGAPLAAETWARVAPALDGYTARWVAARADACSATMVRGEQSEALLDRRLDCLEHARVEVAALLDAFAAADRTTVENAATAADKLPGLAGCSDRRRLLQLRPLPDDPAVLAAIEAIRARLAQARAQHVSGHYGAAVATASVALEQARGPRASVYPPLEAQALLALARAQAAADDREPAAASYHAGLDAAVAAGDDETAAAAAMGLVSLLAIDKKGADALVWADLAHAEVVRSGENPGLEAQLALARGDAHAAALHIELAVADYGRALELVEKLPDVQAELLGRALLSVGRGLEQLTRYPEALTSLQRAEGVYERAFGRAHALTLAPMNEEISVLRHLGRFTEALAQAQSVLAERTRLLGRRHRDVGYTQQMLGDVYYDLGRYSEAADSYREAIAVAEQHSRDGAPVWYPNMLLSFPLAKMGRIDEAFAVLQRSKTIAATKLADNRLVRAYLLDAEAILLEMAGRVDAMGAPLAEALALLRELDPDGWNEADTRSTFARWSCARHRYQEGEDHARRALAILEPRLGRNNVSLWEPLVALGRCQLLQGEAAEALASLERAVALVEGSDIDPNDMAETLAALAAARAQSDPVGARELDRRAAAARARSPFPSRP